MRKVLFILFLNIALTFQGNAQDVQVYSLPSQIPDEWKDFGDRIYLVIEKQAHYLLGAVQTWDKDANLKLLTERTDLIFSGSLSWLSSFYMNNAPDDLTEKAGVKLLESGKIILNRSHKAIQSLSWGSTIMFQSVANDLDRVFDSKTRNGIGYIILKGQTNTLPVKLGKDFQLKTAKNHFKAVFSVTHGAKITAYYTIIALKSSMKISEKLIAGSDVVTQTIATSFYGVLNNKDWVFETGKRNVITDKGKSYTFISGQGGKALVNAKSINIDDVVSFRSKKMMNTSYTSETNK